MAGPSLREQAYTQILAMIVNGEIPKGAVTSEIQLSQKLDMSRTPIRAALQQLELEGFVRIASKHGVIILDSSSQRVGDLLDLIASLALFCVSDAFISRETELRRLAREKEEAYQSLRSADPTEPHALIAFECELLLSSLRLSNNNEMEKIMQSSMARLFWNQNTARWRAPHGTQTDVIVKALIRSIGLDFDSFRFALLDYSRVLKMTWR